MMEHFVSPGGGNVLSPIENDLHATLESQTKDLRSLWLNDNIHPSDAKYTPPSRKITTEDGFKNSSLQ